MNDDIERRLQENHEARQRRSLYDALRQERADCARRGLTDRLPIIDVEIRRVKTAGPLDVQPVDPEDELLRAHTDADRQSMIAALTREREGYEKRGLHDRAELVNEELRRLGAMSKPPRKRAETRLAGGLASRR